MREVMLNKGRWRRWLRLPRHVQYTGDAQREMHSLSADGAGQSGTFLFVVVVWPQRIFGLALARWVESAGHAPAT